MIDNNDKRPDPNELLKRIKNNDKKVKQGKLKIFFGYAAGVGKTYAMLKAAHHAKKANIDVVVGYVEPHLRPQTNKLLDDLEKIETKIITRNGIEFKEFDIDAAIKRHPELILVDELAHTNAKGSRNLKRYQDIEELLRAGINVYTTVNVQHIESLNDMVCQITKICVNERIPDKVLDNADKIELVDIEPEQLITRLSEGKVYKNEQAKRALENFFTIENLAALREIALRRTADQVNKHTEQSKISFNKEYYTNEHILVCLSSSPSNAKVIRTAARMANSLHGNFTALFVETPDTNDLAGANMDRLRANLKLAEQLGAKISTIYGENVPEQIAEYSKAFDVSKIVIGRSNNKKRFIAKKTFVEQLTTLAPNLDIYIIPDNLKPYSQKRKFKIDASKNFSVNDGFKTLFILLSSTLLGFFFFDLGFNEANIIMIYILGVLLTAVYTYGQFYSAISSILSVCVFNFFFTEPRFTFNSYDNGYPVTFVIMFIVAILASSLATRVKNIAQKNALKARSTEVLLETSQMLQKAIDIKHLYIVMGNQLLKLLDNTILVYPVKNNMLSDEPICFKSKSGDKPEDYSKFITNDEIAVARWVFTNNKNAGATTNTLSNAKCLYMAVRGRSDVYAVVGICVKKAKFDAYERNLLVAMLGEFGLSLEKEIINEKKKEIHVKAKQEQLRANLLRAISHDLRTPLTSISGNANILLKNDDVLNNDKKVQLYNDIYDDSMWLINLVENLLSVTRIDNDKMQIEMQPELIDDVITEALQHINRNSTEYKISVESSDDLLMAMMDSRLIIQVLINIVNNAIKYTKPGTAINIKSYKVGREKIAIHISDNGDGISRDDKEKIFDMFFTSDKNLSDSRRGLGLGLPLCKSIIKAHGGEIWVKDNIPKGTIFVFMLQAKEVETLE